ncbi:MAG: orc1/cdc6 family replication initiation protein [Candidatus Thalassarchaeum sp.]|jgi:cell division control protein 6|uniref:Cdc6/Cdc18 family protein n=1 Tax=Candidatus Thalassarchaeum betae TaxID=2599289 RepID=UPI002760F22A|nr:orc1/cdc6 family replication initiation protein [Candidatus Thalassoarchaea betae]MDP7531998.1 orc1/cdc6 family replication initiation protein [Candidatus Thalassarchaeum sp.]|tara:strand:- start:2177 stop:3415 length:1239 start_codon:yes stop_codon:yes gene_type:complete
MDGNIFEKILGQDSLFIDRKAFDHAFEPSNLPHRDHEVEALVRNLVDALNGHIPSNMLLYGVPGSGKTVVTRFVLGQLLDKGVEMGQPVQTYEINCRNVDTKYRVVQTIASQLARRGDTPIPFTGWPTDRVLETLIYRMDRATGVHIIVLDEIDNLVSRAGDDLLYNLTSLNTVLRNARCCIIGISNDLHFTQQLDPRVSSRLSQEDLVFHPYGALEIQDILNERVETGLREDVLEGGVLELCAALAAQEHGDARRALDLLRISVQKAEQRAQARVDPKHVRLAQSQLEYDQVTPVLKSLPLHQKVVLFAIILNEENGLRNISTGEVYRTYADACMKIGVEPLTPRRISSLLNELDTLGLIMARNVSKGRGGRSKQVNSAIPKAIDAIGTMSGSEPLIGEAALGRYTLQGQL